MLPSLSYNVALTPFAVDRPLDAEPGSSGLPEGSLPEADSSRASRVGQAGNAMHAEMIAVPLFYILTRGLAPVRHKLGAQVDPIGAPTPALTACPEDHEIQRLFVDITIRVLQTLREVGKVLKAMTNANCGVPGALGTEEEGELSRSGGRPLVSISGPTSVLEVCVGDRDMVQPMYDLGELDETARQIPMRPTSRNSAPSPPP